MNPHASARTAACSHLRVCCKQYEGSTPLGILPGPCLDHKQVFGLNLLEPANFAVASSTRGLLKSSRFGVSLWGTGEGVVLWIPRVWAQFLLLTRRNGMNSQRRWQMQVVGPMGAGCVNFYPLSLSLSERLVWGNVPRVLKIYLLEGISRMLMSRSAGS